MATAGDRYDERTGNIWSYAYRGDMTGLKAAVVRGVDVNMANTVGWTAAHAAAAGGHVKALRYLVKKMDADLSIADRGGNLPVHHAAKNGHVHALRILQELGADVTKVRLSQAKGKAVRELVSESYRKAGVNQTVDNDEDFDRAVGYDRKQSKSTAFWGPRRTPISCAIKKKIIKDKRKIRKEKHKAKSDSTKGMDKGEEKEVVDETEDNVEPSYVETVREIKLQRKKKRRGRQKSRSPATVEEQTKEEDLMEQTKLNSNKIEGCRKNDTIQKSFENEEEDDTEQSKSSDNDDQKLLTSSTFRFAALSLTDDDSDSE